MNETTADDPRPAGAPGSRTHQVLRHTAIRTSAEVLGKIATLGWTVAAVRVLTQQDFGALSYAMSLMLLVSALPSWGFDTGVTYEGSRSPDQLNALYSRTLVWKTVLGIPILAATGVVVGLHRPNADATLVLVLVLLAGLPEIYSLTSRAAAAAREEAVGISAALVGQRLLTGAGVALALVLDTGVVGVSVAFLVTSFLGWGAHIQATRRVGVRFEASTVSWVGLRDLLSQTITVGASAIVLVALFRVDMVLLGLLVGDQAVAQYTVAYRLLETVLFVTFAINQSVVPIMSASVDGVQARRALEQALSLAAFLYLPFAVVALAEGDRIIPALFGSSYGTESVACLAWLAPAPLLFAGSFLISSLMTARRRYFPTLVAAVIATVVNVGLNLYLIPRFESVGAAAATTISFVIQLGILVIGLRVIGERASVLAPLVVSSLASLVLTVVVVVLHAPLFVELVVGAAVYLTLWFLLARRLAPVQAEVALSFVRRRART